MKSKVAAMALILLPWALLAQTVLRIGTGELPPYVSRDERNSMITRIMKEVQKEMGVSFEYSFMPWTRCERALQTGEVWGILPYVRNSERAEKYLFSQELCHKRTVFFYYSKGKAPIPRYSDLGDLRKYSIGGIRGYFYESAFKEAGLKIEYAESEEQNLRKLRDGRIDLAPVGDKTGWFLIRRLFPGEEGNFHLIEKPLDVGSLFLMARKGDKGASDALRLFDEALARVKKKSVYLGIIGEY
jgi:polar amino acid transport system substrate-binding protein